MISVAAIGWKAHAALGGGAPPRRLATLRDSRYLRAGDEIVWVGPVGAALHARAILTSDPGPALEASTFRLDGVVPWHPPRIGRIDGARVAAGARTLADALTATGTPRGFGALLAGRAPEGLLAGVSDAAWRFARAAADDDAAAAAGAAIPLLGLGPGLTPAGDDFVGGAFFARRLAGRTPAWDAAVTRVRAAAGGRTHPISAALLGDLLDGEGWAPLHDLAAALAVGAPAAALAAARRLVRLGHSSGWDLVAGFAAGTGALVGIQPAAR